MSKIDNLFSKLYDFIEEIETAELDQQQFASISKSIVKTKSYSDGEIDSIDLLNFAQNVDNDKTQDLVNAVKETVSYNKTTDLVENSNGISIYIPYSELEYYEQMLEIYPKLGISDEYTNTLTKLANYIVGGKDDTYTIGDYTFEEEEDYSSYDWFNQDFIDSNSSYFESNEYEELEVIEKDGNYVLELSDEDWDVIVDITCEVFYDDG